MSENIFAPFMREALALAERLGRIYGIRVEVAARLGEYTFSGKIRQDRGVEYILNLLSEAAITDIVTRFARAMNDLGANIDPANALEALRRHYASRVAAE